MPPPTITTSTWSSLYWTNGRVGLKTDATLLSRTFAPAGATTDPPPVDPPTGGIDEIVRYTGRDATVIAGQWSTSSDPSAADGALLQNANAGAAKLAAAREAPTDYFEITFDADAGRPYRLWLRGKALGNSWANDSVFVLGCRRRERRSAVPHRHAIGDDRESRGRERRRARRLGLAGQRLWRRRHGSGDRLRDRGAADAPHPAPRRRARNRSGRVVSGEVPVVAARRAEERQYCV